MGGLHIIWNPVAGNGAAVKAHASVCTELDRRGILFTEQETAYPGHAVMLAREAAGKYEKVLVLGGDGTVRDISIGVIGSDTVLGIVPCGTGNDLVRPLGIPRDPVEALNVALGGRVRLMDAAMVNDELFFNISAFGFDVDVLNYVEVYKKKIRNGSLAYKAGLLRALMHLTSRRVTLTWPEGRLETNALIVAAANGTHFGGGMKIAPDADPFDGKLDVCVIHDITYRNALIILPSFLKGKHLKYRDNVEYFRTTELTATAEPASRIDIDGELMPGTPVTFRILPQKLKVVVPE